MSETKLFRVQHKKLVSLLEELNTHLDAGISPSNASRVRSLLSQLASTLSVHLYLEDKELYLEILNDRDPAVRSKAKAYMDEMGDLMAAFKVYLAKYPTTEQILAESTTFVEDTRAIFKALSKRMEAEEADLFVMLEGLR